MNIEQEIQNILDRNFTRGDNAKALKELLDLFNVLLIQREAKIEELIKLPSIVDALDTLQLAINGCEKYGTNPDTISWGLEEGVLIDLNSAKTILKTILECGS